MISLTMNPNPVIKIKSIQILPYHCFWHFFLTQAIYNRAKAGFYSPKNPSDYSIAAPDESELHFVAHSKDKRFRKLSAKESFYPPKF